MGEFLDIAFIGAGNLAWHLAPALENLGHRVAFVNNRNHKAREALINRLYNAQPHSTLDFSDCRVNLIVLAVSDGAIHEVASELVLPDGCILVHTSGSTDMEKLMRAVPEHAGVLYPLYSFSRNDKVNFHDIPFFIEASDLSTEKLLLQLGKELTKYVFKLSSRDRAKLHLAAVFANNFSNHMLSIAEQIISSEKLPFELIQPMVMGSMQKAFTMGPFQSQTGPAIRCDNDTMTKHLNLLSDNPDLSEMYFMISNHIMKMHEKKMD